MKKWMVVAIVLLLLVPVSGAAEANPGSPELRIVEISVQAPDPADPTRVRVEITIGNSGDIPAGAFAVRWYPHQAVNEVGCSIDIPGLGAHKKGTTRCSYTYPQCGDLHWRAVVDEENEIGEPNENNNTATGMVHLACENQGGSPPAGTAPDLLIEDAHFEPAEIVQGQPFKAVAYVRNASPVAIAEPFTALWEFDPLLGLQNCLWQFENGMGAGARVRVSCERMTHMSPGRYPTAPTADTDNTIAESDEINNDVSAPLTIAASGLVPAAARPDLLIEQAYFEPAQPVSGQLFQAKVVVLNNSQVPVTEPYSVKWHFHAALGLQDCTWHMDEDLGPGLRARMACSQIISVAPGGQAPTTITADTDDTIDEANEANNELNLALVVAAQGSGPLPDLLIEDAHFEPVHPVPGEPFRAIMKIRNASQVDVTQPFSALWHFHEALGVQDCVWQFENGLVAGGAKSLQCTRTSAVMPGQAPTAPTVDTDNVIAESNEVNNDMPVTLILYAEDHPEGVGTPDLIVRDLRFSPNPVSAGQDLYVEFEVVNQGNGPAPASVAQLTTPPGAGLSFRCEVPSLPPAGSSHCTWQFTAPSRRLTYGARAAADIENVVNEGAREDNNSLKETFTVH